jgi:hypothetical protein
MVLSPLIDLCCVIVSIIIRIVSLVDVVGFMNVINRVKPPTEEEVDQQDE